MLRVLPLGGVGEFGKNSLIIEYGEQMLLIDAGMKLPEDDMFGVDLVIPDFSYVLERIERLQGIILTHGHEDHVGSVPFLLRQCATTGPVHIYGSKLTLELVRARLVESSIIRPLEFHELAAGQRYGAGIFDFRLLEVAHSIPMSMAVDIRLPNGARVLHSGDYRLDESMNRPECLEYLARRGDMGDILLFLGDSTNVEREGNSQCEASVREGLNSVYRDAPGSIITAVFSSSIYRVESILALAEELGRRVAVCGFNLERNFGIAKQLGLIRCPDHLVLPVGKLKSLPANQRLVLTTGTQGESGSALSRLAHGNFKGYAIEPGDRVVLSSRIIPGNERSILRMVNHFYRRGASVFTERDANVHGSGHAYRNEMKQMLEWIRPRYFMPIHGELRQLMRSAELAESVGMERDKILLLENGTALEIMNGRSRRIRTDHAGQVLVDGKKISDVHEVVLKDRKHLSGDGMLTVIMVIDRQSHRIIAGPDLVSRGFVFVDDHELLMDECKNVAIRSFNSCDHDGQTGWDEVKAVVRKALRKYLAQRTDRYPVILPVVVEI